MITQVFSVLDAKIGSFMQPWFSATVDSARRAFFDACQDSASLLGRHPQDFTLYHLGSFDDETGLFDCKLIALGNATALLQKD